MTITTTTNDKKNSDSWGLDTSSLDDWLENDLKQSSLFNRHKQADNKTTTKCSLSHIITQDTTSLQQKDNESIEIKTEDNEERLQQCRMQPDNNNTSPLPIHLTRLIKIYSLLNTVRQQQNNNNNNNIKHEQVPTTTYIPPITPPSPVMSMTSSNASSSNKTTTTTTTGKKRRGNNRTPVDEVVKRQRNTDAARRSRLKKTMKMDSLEKQVDELKTDNDRLRVKVAVLETEICQVTEKERNNRQRVLELEAQLANAHHQLVKDYQSK